MSCGRSGAHELGEAGEDRRGLVRRSPVVQHRQAVCRVAADSVQAVLGHIGDRAHGGGAPVRQLRGFQRYGQAESASCTDSRPSYRLAVHTSLPSFGRRGQLAKRLKPGPHGATVARVDAQTRLRQGADFGVRSHHESSVKWIQSMWSAVSSTPRLSVSSLGRR